MKIGLIELTLLQFIIYMGVYLLSNYVGIMLCVVMAPIFFFILVISIFAEFFDRSKVPGLYFKFMISGFIVPLIVLITGIALDPSALDWLNQ